MKAKESDKENARKELLEILKPGDTVYCVLRHASRSGMQWEISFFTEGMRRIDSQVCGALDMRRGKHDGIIVGGCGMDTGFRVVYNLAHVLFPEGFGCTGRSEHPNMCPSNDHSNGDRDYKPHKHSDGGYALRHRWI